MRTERPPGDAAATVPSSLVDALERCGARHIVHLGGGDGRFLAALLSRLPTTTGVLHDEERAIAGAPAVLAAVGVGDRIDVMVAARTGSVPIGGDVYLVSLHDLSEGSEVIRACRTAMASTAHLVVLDRTTSAPSPRRVRDLINLLDHGGFDVSSRDVTDPTGTVLIAQPRPV